MTRIVRIATTSLATLEDTAPPYNLRYPNPADTLQLGLALLDGAGGQGADLAVLPEAFMAAGLPGEQIRPAAQPVPGPAFNAVAEKAAALPHVRRGRFPCARTATTSTTSRS